MTHGHGTCLCARGQSREPLCRDQGPNWVEVQSGDYAAFKFQPHPRHDPTLRGLWLTYVGRGEEALRSMDADLRRNRFPPTWHWDCRGIAFFQIVPLDLV
jgi:hypothetical protein